MKKLKIWKWISLFVDKDFWFIIEYKGRKVLEREIELNKKKIEKIEKYVKRRKHLLVDSNIKNNKVNKNKIYCNCIMGQEHWLEINKNKLKIKLIEKTKQDWILLSTEGINALLTLLK